MKTKGTKDMQKIKLLKLMELLRQETDENYPMRTGDICRRLGEMNINCERRTLGDDIRLLKRMGYEVMDEKRGHQNAYWIADRSFEVPELKVLIDAVQAAGFIPEDKTQVLTDKIAALGGSHQAEIMKSNIVRFNTRKHHNNEIFYTVDTLTRAIQNRKRVEFTYYDLNENLEKVYRRDGEKYTVSPAALVFSEDYYYLLSCSAHHEGYTTYRLDRMDRVTVTDEDAALPEDFDEQSLGQYTESVFKMFEGR